MRRRPLAFLLTLASAFAVTAALPAPARAFCGFYVSGGGAKVFNNATMVVLLRDGTRTVLSMQNNYQGPPEAFAMVVPVPVVLQKDDVKTLPNAVFDRIDELAAPRLVEYWEENPCPEEGGDGVAYGRGWARMPALKAAAGATRDELETPKVVVLAQFAVAEYEVVILGAEDSLALDGWLRKEGYKIPDGAEPYLRPYVQAGMKFFVTKVDPKKVRFEKGQAMLSPLRFHYDTETFSLPVRLGLMNSSGTQDLIVHVLAKNTRYEVANYDNVAIPTNLDVNPGTKQGFGAFYASLFDHTVSKHPGTVITEYAWTSSKCDPCPGPPLQPQDLHLLGGDVTSLKSPNTLVLTRLHARYRKDTSGEDLVFREAPPIEGGREGLEPGAHTSGNRGNAFQARYAIRHPWAGPIKCKNPQRGVWGEPPPGIDPSPVMPAKKTAFAQRDPKTLTWLLGPMTKAKGMEGGDLLGKAGPLPAPTPIAAPTTNTVAAPAIATAPATVEAPATAAAPATATATATAPAPSTAPLPSPPPPPPGGGCAGCVVGGEEAGGVFAGVGLLLAGILGRRRFRGRKLP